MNLFQRYVKGDPLSKKRPCSCTFLKDVFWFQRKGVEGSHAMLMSNLHDLPGPVSGFCFDINCSFFACFLPCQHPPSEQTCLASEADVTATSGRQILPCMSLLSHALL